MQSSTHAKQHIYNAPQGLTLKINNVNIKKTDAFKQINTTFMHDC